MSPEILAQNLGISILMYSTDCETAWIIQGYRQELVGWLGQLPALVNTMDDSTILYPTISSA